MSDRDALYEAILANPDEDTPRLLYADWLEEHGQAKVAKHIRAACELARLDEDDPSLAAFPAEAPSFWQSVAPEVAKRQTLASVTLPREHAKAELARLPKAKGFNTGNVAGAGSPFRRGFVERACFKTPADFVRHADAVFRAAPIRELVIEDPGDGDLARVAESRLFPQIHSLTLGTGSSHRVTEFDLVSLSESGSIRNLRSLRIADAEPDCLLVLARDREWGGIRSLSVARWEVSDNAPNADEQLVALFNAKHLRALTSIELDRVQIDSAEASDAITTARLSELRVLTFRSEGGGLGEAVAASKQLRNLRAFTVENSYLDGPELARMLRSPNLPSLAVLDLTRNWIEGFGKSDFKGVRRPALRRLAVSSHRDRVTTAWEPLFKWVATSQVASFALGGDTVGNAKPAAGALQALMKCGEFPNLRRIELRKELMSQAVRKHFGTRLREWGS